MLRRRKESGIADARAAVMAVTKAGVVVQLQWREPSSSAPSELFQVLRLRDGKVVDMEDHADRLSALRAVDAA